MRDVSAAACFGFIELSAPSEILTILEQEALKGDQMMEMECKHFNFMTDWCHFLKTKS